jgi:hypothetical protein
MNRWQRVLAVFRKPNPHKHRRVNAPAQFTRPLTDTQRQDILAELGVSDDTGRSALVEEEENTSWP